MDEGNIQTCITAARMAKDEMDMIYSELTSGHVSEHYLQEKMKALKLSLGIIDYRISKDD